MRFAFPVVKGHLNMSNGNGQVALILGSSSGIGNACAKALGSDGFRVHGVARSVDKKGDFTQVRADLTNPSDQGIVNSLILKTDPDALVFCAGESLSDSIKNIDISITRHLVEVNALSLLNPLKVLATELPVKPRSVVLVSSIHARGQFDRLSYSISKNALEAIMASTYEYLMEQGTRINCVRPGPTETGMLLKNFPIESEARKAYLERIPARRFAHTREVVGIIRFLLSKRASYITGQTIEITGGF